MCSASSTSWARTASMPTPIRYSAAAPTPTASAIGGVPASNFQGRSAQVLPSVVTFEIISPPPRKGPMASRISGLPTRQPMPVGPSILWPVKAKKSQPIDDTSTGMWGTLCEPSTRQSAPRSWASWAISATGLMVPRTLLA